LEGLKISSLLIGENPETKERYLEVRLDKTLRIYGYYNLNVERV